MMILNKLGQTAFHVAKDLDIAKSLFDFGCPVGEHDDNDDSPIHTHAKAGNLSVIRYLVSKSSRGAISHRNKASFTHGIRVFD